MVEISPLIARRSRISASVFTGRPTPAVTEIDPQSKALLNSNSVQLGLVSRQVENLSARVNRLSSSLESVRVNLATSQALERQKERQEQILETKLAQQKLREGKESLIEKKITAAALKPALVLGNKARSSLFSLSNIFTRLFGAFLAFKGVETIKALAEGNTEKLEEIKNQVLLTVGGFIGLNLALRLATGTLSLGFLKIAGGLALLSAAIIFKEPILNAIESIKKARDNSVRAWLGLDDESQSDPDELPKPGATLEPSPDPDKLPEPGATKQPPSDNTTDNTRDASDPNIMSDGSIISPGDIVGGDDFNQPLKDDKGDRTGGKGDRNEDTQPKPENLDGKGGGDNIEPKLPNYGLFDYFDPSSMIKRIREEEKINSNDINLSNIETKTTLLSTSREQEFRKKTAERESRPENQVGAKATDPEILKMIEEERNINNPKKVNIDPVPNNNSQVVKNVSQSTDKQSINVIPMPIPMDSGNDAVGVNVSSGAIGGGPGISIPSSNPNNPYILGALAQYNVVA